MIFVTVGTHEQQFNRLVQKIDDLKRDGIITEEVFIQTGYSTYEPQHCEWSKIIPYSEMIQKVRDARIVITHGGPATFIMPLQEGKIPVVVPRQFQFDEHVNDHQVDFSKFIEQRQGNIIVVTDIDELEKTITNYDELINSSSNSVSSNSVEFNSNINKIIQAFGGVK